MQIEFTKMHGAGNDFVVVDGVRKSISLSSEQIQATFQEMSLLSFILEMKLTQILKNF